MNVWRWLGFVAVVVVMAALDLLAMLVIARVLLDLLADAVSERLEGRREP